MHKILAIFVLMMSFGAGANDVDPRLAYFGIDRSSYAPLSCPASNETLKDFRGKLLRLKGAIKKDAANCNGLNQDIEGLADLVTKDRETFLSLVTKGQLEGLSQQEQQSIEKYVENISVKASTLVSVLSGNDACFEEDKKGTSLEFIASLIGESSKILSVIGGPQIGGLVSVASGVISGFSNAMQVISRNAQGYDFSDPEQKIAYADSLCALFDYRQELNTLLNPYETSDRLDQLSTSLQRQISLLKQRCMECSELIDAVNLRTLQVTRAGVLELESVDQVWSDEFDAEIFLRAQEIDQIYTNSIGTHTYRALKMRTWLPLRNRAIESSQISADLGLASVLFEMNNIEEFMIDDQAKGFIKQLAEDADDWQSKLHTYLVLEGDYLAMDLRIPLGYDYYSMMTMEERYAAIVQTLVDGAARTSDSRVKARIRSYFSGFNLLSQGLNVSIDVANRYCLFFENSDWYRDSVASVCPNRKVQRLSEDAVLFTQFRFQMSPYAPMDTSKIADTSSVVVTADWMETMARAISDLSGQSGYVLRQSDINQGPQ